MEERSSLVSESWSQDLLKKKNKKIMTKSRFSIPECGDAGILYALQKHSKLSKKP